MDRSVGKPEAARLLSPQGTIARVGNQELARLPEVLHLSELSEIMDHVNLGAPLKLVRG